MFARSGPLVLTFAMLLVLGSPAGAVPQCVGASTASWPRKESASARLNIRWRTAVVSVQRGQDRKPKPGQELALAAAIKELRERDRRPLLVFRDHRDLEDRKLANLIDRLLESERLRLASRWFRCVRVPKNSSEAGHPYAKLFPGTKPPHLLLISASGKKHVRLLGSAKSKASWSAIASVLREDYRRDPTSRIREYQELLNQFDASDSRIAALEDRIVASREKREKRKTKRLEAKLAEAFKQRNELLKLEHRTADLGLAKAERAVPVRRRRHDGGRRRPR